MTRRPSHRRDPYALLLALVLLTIPKPAHAGNEDEFFAGDQAAMTAGAVTATVSEGPSLIYNPAGLVAGDHVNHLNASATVYGLRHYRTGPLLTLPGGSTLGGSLNEIVVVPTTLAYVRQLGPLRIGVGLFQRSASSLRLRAFQSETNGTEELAWAVAITSSAESYDGVLGTAFELPHGFSLGFAIHGLVNSVSGTVDLAGGLTDTAAMEASNFFSSSDIISQLSVEARASIGVQWSPIPTLRFGFSVDTPARRLFVTTSVDEVSSERTPTRSNFSTTSLDISDWRFERSRPAHFRAGAAVLGAWGSLALDASVLHALPSDDRKRVWNLRLGAMIDASELVSVGAGLFTDRAAERRPRSFGVARADTYGATLGVRILDIMALASGESSDAIRWGTTLALRYAYGRGEVGGIVVGPVPDATRADFSSLRQSSFRIHDVGFHLGSSLAF